MNSRMTRIGFSRGLALAALGATFALAGCGNKAQDGTRTTMTPHKPNVSTTAGKAGQAARDAKGAVAAEESRMASAVVSGKTSAPVDLRYELTTKPAIGQPLEIELAFLPTAPAETLEVVVSGMPGLAVASGQAVKFEKVQAGETYTHKFLVQASGSGTYYVSVIAKMVSQVQTEVRTFSVPVVFGTAPAAQKPAPAKDANGEPIESMPATER
jgi:hypothetical protein